MTSTQWAPKQKGFTIVELLIVIVVIAILAAITVVAYNGITQRTYDTVIKNDLDNFAKVIRQYEAVNGDLPKSGWQTGSSTTFPGVRFKPSKQAYDTSNTNLFYCTGTRVSTSEQSFIVAARSKSGKVFIYSPETGLKEVTGTIQSNCYATGTWSGTAGTDFGYSYGYYHVDDVWWSWTN